MMVDSWKSSHISLTIFIARMCKNKYVIKVLHLNCSRTGFNIITLSVKSNDITRWYHQTSPGPYMLLIQRGVIPYFKASTSFNLKTVSLLAKIAQRCEHIFHIITLFPYICNIFSYRQTSSTRHSESKNLNVSRLVLQFPLPYPLNPGVESRMIM